MTATKEKNHSTKDLIKVFIVDDHPLVRDGIKTNVSTASNIEIVGEADNVADAREMARNLHPDVVIMDLKLPETSGVEGIRQLIKDEPECRVLVLTMYDDPHYVRESIRAGAKGYLLKQSAPTDLVQALQVVARGGGYFDPLASDSLADLPVKHAGDSPPPSELTKREREILCMIAEGLSNKEVAAELHLSVRTVETHRERIMRKLDIRGTAALTKYAISNKLIDFQ
jgi:two-component system, NarL family, nitrate/nitrite response regulator NarL